MRILIINGPNLDLLGIREPHIYGSRTFEECLGELRASFPDTSIGYAQSNVEGEIVGLLRARAAEVDAFILNAGGYSHTSVAIRDTIAVLDKPVVEVHISNIHGREEFRHNTITGGVCAGVITGFGLAGYHMAVAYLLRSV
ncbi:MAG: 3-dehydroquinate dehydratase [Flavobacteriales bacterium]|nr:3-dehydroquinate dehydratase [Flavobacteriales bacterium]